MSVSGPPDEQAAGPSEADLTRRTTILEALNLDGPIDVAQVMPLVYDELRAIARRRLRSERVDHTLQPTALVHEAYVRLAEAGEMSVEGKGHFLGLAARAMRQVLVDSARARGAAKRGGAWQRVTLDANQVGVDAESVDILSLHQALERLEKLDPELERLVELRFFAGMTVAEAAEVLAISPRKAAKDWSAVRLWLRRELAED